MLVAPILGFVLAASAAQAEAWHIDVVQPTLVDAPPAHVYVPLGFDDNDNAQIVLDGALPSTCYKLGPTEVRVDHENWKIHLRQRAYFYPGGWCADVLVPYVQTVSLGIMNKGHYEIDVERGGDQILEHEELPIVAATTANPDDFTYAPVTELQLTRSEDARTHRREVLLKLSGYFSTSCMEFHELKVTVRPNRVIEVLPIVDVRQAADCAQVTTEFDIPVSLSNVPAGRYLIHVRSLNGQSLNRVLDL